MATLRFFLMAAFPLLFMACSGDKEEPRDTGPNLPKPYELAIPATLPKNFVIPPDNPMTLEGVELGRHLFYETKLSRDNTLSCGSCHQQQLAFTDAKGLSTGINNAKTKRGSMSLANMLWFSQFNWDGSSNTLEDQAVGPLEDPLEMHQPIHESVKKLQETELYPPLFEKAFGSPTITRENILKALAQFQRTLISGNSRYDRYLQNKEVFTPDEVEGMVLFMTHPDPTTNTRGGNCGDCHGGVLLTTRTFHNNGLDAQPKDNGLGDVTGRASDKGKFKSPSLRNIALTAPYMHDGRFKTLEEVLDHYNEHIRFDTPNLDPLIIEATNTPNGTSLGLTAEEKRKIIVFLHTLTDTTFIKDKRFSNPFK
jgi:cytochrome c peroxidase